VEKQVEDLNEHIKILSQKHSKDTDSKLSQAQEEQIEYLKQIEELQAEKEQLSEAVESYRDEIREAKTIVADLQEKNAQQLSSVAQKYDLMEQSHRKELENLTSQIENLKAVHARTIQESQAKSQIQIQELKKSHDEKVAQLKAAHEKQKTSVKISSPVQTQQTPQTAAVKSQKKQKATVSMVLMKKDGPYKKFPLSKTCTVIGRHPSCDFCLPIRSVSKKHCQITWYKGLLEIEDLNSRNGISLNGQTVDKSEVNDGDKIRIGSLEFQFQFENA
jgi:hypothetical protein